MSRSLTGLYQILGRDIQLGPPQTLHENTSLYDPESAALLRKMLSLAAESGPPQRFDLRTKAGDGEEYYVQVVAVPRKVSLPITGTGGHGKGGHAGYRSGAGHLQTLDCDARQGYLYAKLLAAVDCEG